MMWLIAIIQTFKAVLRSRMRGCPILSRVGDGLNRPSREIIGTWRRSGSSYSRIRRGIGIVDRPSHPFPTLEGVGYPAWNPDRDSLSLPRNLKRLRFATILCGGIGLIAGCSQLPPQAVHQIEQARVMLDTQRYAACERQLSPIIEVHRRQTGIAEAFYMRGQCRLMAGKREEARRDFQAASRLAHDKDLLARIEAQLGNMAFDDVWYDRACEHYARALEHLPGEPPTDRVLYQYGVALQRSRRFAQARQVFAKVDSQYPASEFASAARGKQDWNGKYYAVQCGAYDRIDLARKAAARLRKSGINAIVFPIRRNGRTRHVIRVGRFQTYREVSRKLEQVRHVQPDAFIVP